MSLEPHLALRFLPLPPPRAPVALANLTCQGHQALLLGVHLQCQGEGSAVQLQGALALQLSAQLLLPLLCLPHKREVRGNKK